MECLGDETIAAYVDGALEPFAITQIDHHIDSCAGCRAHLSAVAAIPVVHSFVSEAVGSSPPVDLALAIAASLPDEELPEIAIGRYIVHRVIGRGGMGVVLRARDPELEREVAIKLVDPSAAQHASANGSSGSGSWRARLRAEARAMAKLRHPNVVTVYDAGAVGNQLFVAMELVDGENLARHLARDRSSALALCLAAGRGLCAAHAAGLVHGDVKPDNILVDRDGRALIGDFGLTRAIALGAPADSAIVGTPAYMAPELLRRQPADPRSDQFALAVTVYEACTGERPWRAESIDRLLDAIEHTPRIRPAGLSRAVWRVVERGLAADPDARYPSVASFVDALDRARRSGPARRRRVGFVAATALAIASIGAVIGLRGSSDRAVTCADPIERTTAMVGTSLCGSTPSKACAALTTELAERATAWRAAHVGICRASRDGDQSAGALDRRMGCLAERELEQVALIGRLRAPVADADAFPAASAVHHFESPSACSTYDREARGVPLGKLAAVVAAKVWIATANADYTLGHYRAGAVAIAGHLDAIRAVGDQALVAKAAEVLGELQRLDGDLDGAERSYDLGLPAAAQAGDDDDTAKLLLDRAYLMGEGREQWARAGELIRAAEVAVVRAGRPTDLEAMLDLAQGRLADANGNFEDARRHYAAAAELWRTSSDPTNGATALQQVCHVDDELGKVADARTSCEEAVRLLRADVGDAHPVVAAAENELAVAIVMTGDLPTARKHWETALAILDADPNGDDEIRMRIVLNLATASRMVADNAAADRYLARAVKLSAEGPITASSIDIRVKIAAVVRETGQAGGGLAVLEDLAKRAEATLGVHSATTAHAYGVLGDAYLDARREADARGAYEKSVAMSSEVYGPRHPTTLSQIEKLGTVLTVTGDARTAWPMLENALLVLEETSEPDASIVAEAHVNVARCASMLGDSTRAEAEARKGLAIIDRRSDEPMQAAELRFEIAKVLWRAHRATEAVALARKARDEMRAIGPSASSLPDVERWLAGAR